MKKKISWVIRITSLRFTRSILLGALMVIACFASVRAQTVPTRSAVVPFVSCVELEFAASGAATGNYIAYYGYSSSNSVAITISPNTPSNYFTPIPDVPAHPSRFFPGIHYRVVAVSVPIGTSETWFLGTSFVTASYSNSQLCGDDGTNSRLITYQGRLTDGAMAANGEYDLRFQLFDALTGGTARSSAITLENVQVTNGVFTVQLDLGLNPAILDAVNTFVEIGVRAGKATGAFTTLTPRQPLTAVPLAIRANTAAASFRATYADRGSAGFQIDGDARVTGNLTVGGSISGASKNFKIDHPLDPLNKTLTYTSVESPDMKNIYDGNVTTDGNGEATVTMPGYFEALNKDFRYQLTVIGTFAQAIVVEEIRGSTFKIKTDKPNVKVSWQVTGVRQDKFAEDNRVPVEQNKTGANKGRCFYSPACKQN